MAHGGAGLQPLSYTLQNELREIFRKERGGEFLFEGKRWYDLIRWGIFIATIKAHMPGGESISHISPVMITQHL